jgi:hypothetical protein
LVNGERRLTEKEMLRLQGFPENFKIACGYSATRKQAGNAVPVPMIKAVINSALEADNQKQALLLRGTVSIQDQLPLPSLCNGKRTA